VKRLSSRFSKVSQIQAARATKTASSSRAAAAVTSSSQAKTTITISRTTLK
jgi:hypothetical protein